MIKNISIIDAVKNIYPIDSNFMVLEFLHNFLPIFAPIAIPIKNSANVYENACGTDIPANEIMRIHIISNERLKNPLKKDTIYTR